MDKYISQFGQIYFSIWTNIFLNLDKYISQSLQIHFLILTNIFCIGKVKAWWPKLVEADHLLLYILWIFYIYTKSSSPKKLAFLFVIKQLKVSRFYLSIYRKINWILEVSIDKHFPKTLPLSTFLWIELSLFRDGTSRQSEPFQM